MTFKEYLEALDSGDISKWVYDNKTNKGKFAEIKAKSILKKVYSEGECPIDKFKIYREVEDLVFGQFISIEKTLMSGAKFNTKLYLVAKMIIRPLTDSVFDNENQEKEQILSEAILSEDCQNVLRVVNKFLDKRNEFINVKYSGVFYKSNDEDEDESTDISDVSNNDGNMYWYSLVRTLSNDDIHQQPNTLMLDMSVVASEVAYIRKEEQKAEHQRKIDELKSKIKR